jgi:hypothetical protein
MRKLTEEQWKQEVLVEARFNFKEAEAAGRQFRHPESPVSQWEDLTPEVQRAWLDEAEAELSQKAQVAA